MPKAMTPTLSETQLRRAAAQGDIATVKQCLDEKINPNSPSSNGNTALHWSILEHQYDITKLLLTVSDIEVDARNTQGHTPLHIATLQGDKNTVYRLLKAGAGQKNRMDNEGFSALDYACKKSYSFILTLLKKQFPDWAFKDEKKLAEEIYEKFKRNSFSLKINPQIIDPNYLFDRKVLAYFQPGNQYTLTDIQLAITKKIIDPDKLFVSGNLLQSAATSRVDTLKKILWLLIEKNVDPNTQGSCELNPSSYKDTALHILIANEDELESLELIELLVADNRFNFNLTDSEGKTCLCLAVKLGLSEVAKKLISLKNKVDLDVADEEGNTPLHYAFLLGHLAIAEALIKNQCQKNINNKKHQTPYELLSSSNEEDVRDCLETTWINPDRKTREAQTYIQRCMKNRETIKNQWACNRLPLSIDHKKKIIRFHMAAATGDLSSLQAHCDSTTLNQVNSKGNTALHLACAHGHEELVRFLWECSDLDFHRNNHENLKAVDLIRHLPLAYLFKEKLSMTIKGTVEEEIKDTLDRLEQRINNLSQETQLSLKNY